MARPVAVPDSLVGERVDRAVAMLTGLTRAEVAALVTSGGISVNGVAVQTRSRRVEQGDVLDIEMPEPTNAQLAPDAGVVFTEIAVDSAVIVVDKPAGLVVHPGAGVRSATLVHGLLARYPDLAAQEWTDPHRPGIVHRLDKDTSGLLMVGRTPAATANLTRQLRARTATRQYLALAIGEVEHEAGTIDAPIGRSDRNRTRMAVASGGRAARTHYKVIERLDGATLLECTLDTGRTHQIRVHLAAIGHPVAGDSRYRGAAVGGGRRPFLHAYKLAFDHPVSGERTEFESALPGDLEAVRKAVRTAR